MSISASMNAGISGLNANANKLATISDNIANAQTMGYKRADVDFASVAIGENVRTYTPGGVRTTALRDVEAKGGFVGTGNATDLAIAGRGMLPVTSTTAVAAGAAELPLMLVPTGSFQLDANGVLRTASGHALLGWPADANGNIGEPPRGTAAALRAVTVDRSSVASQPTSAITMNANLPSTATLPGAPVPVSYPVAIEYFDTLGSSQTMLFSFSPATTTDADGNLVPVPNTWVLEVTDNAGPTPMGSMEIEFDADIGSAGNIRAATVTGGPATYDPATGDMTLGVAGGQTITVALGAAGSQPQYLSQLASVFSPVGVTKNGAPAGTFAGLSIDARGFLSVNYSSGFSQTIYKIPVGDVPNLNGLKAVDGQAFVVTNASGPVFFWDAGTGPVGSVTGFAMEQSTTDIARELTQLIQTQRSYSSNAKIIQTVDEMLQETTNLKR